MCITKILANRLRNVLSHLVGLHETAFINGRRIRDSILLAQELLRNYLRNRGTPCCALKVDLMKAYDMMRWTLFLRYLGPLTSPTKLYSGLWSGRELRQVASMSPYYLFVLVMEAFSELMEGMVHGSSNFIGGVKKIEDFLSLFCWRPPKFL